MSSAKGKILHNSIDFLITTPIKTLVGHHHSFWPLLNGVSAGATHFVVCRICDYWVSGVLLCKSSLQCTDSLFCDILRGCYHFSRFAPRQGLALDQLDTMYWQRHSQRACNSQFDDFSTRPDGTNEFLYYALRLLRRCTSCVPVQRLFDSTRGYVIECSTIASPI